MVQITSTELDNNQGEARTIHESLADTDYDSDSLLLKGYDYANFQHIGPAPIACYPMHEDSGTTLHDLAGTRDATNFSGGPTLGAEGLLAGSGVSLDGVDDEIRFPQFGELEGASSFTYCLWVNAPASTWSDTSNDHVFFSYTDDASDSAVRIHHSSGADGELTAWTENNDNRARVQSVVPYTGGAWHWIVFKYSGGPTSGTAQLYFDAVSQGTATGDCGDNISNSPTLGDDDPNVPWGGGINAEANFADLRMYDDVLSDTEIDTLYQIATQQGNVTTGAVTV